MHTTGRHNLSLDEDWCFQADTAGIGEHEEWQITGLPAPRKVAVPHTWNVEEGLEEHRGAGWYEYSISIPEAWSGSRFRLHFEAVYRDAVIWVNGQRAGSHVNSGYTAFELEVTAHILHGKENRITVKADNSPSAQALPQGRSFDWADDGGIIRPVQLIVTGPAAVQHIRVTPEVRFGPAGLQASGRLLAEVQLCGPSASATVETLILKEGTRIWGISSLCLRNPRPGSLPGWSGSRWTYGISIIRSSISLSSPSVKAGSFMMR